MNKSQGSESSLCQLIEEIIPLLHCSDSIERFLSAIANFELDIQNLEARVENIQQEIDTLIAEQQDGVETNKIL